MFITWKKTTMKANVLSHFINLFFKFSLSPALSRAHTHALTHSSLSAWTVLLWIISFSYGTALMAQRARVMPIPLFLEGAPHASVRAPACVRLFCMLQAFSHAPLFLPCVSIKLTCRWKRNFLHRSLLWCRYRRSSTDSAHICFICALCRSQHEAFSVHGNRTVAPSNSPPPPPTPVYLQLAP